MLAAKGARATGMGLPSASLAAARQRHGDDVVQSTPRYLGLDWFLLKCSLVMLLCRSS